MKTPEELAKSRAFEVPSERGLVVHVEDVADLIRAERTQPAPEVRDAVECYTCFLIKTGLLDHLDPCPQRCDKGRVWVRAKENGKGEK